MNYALELTVWEREDGLILDWQYKKELFDGETIEQMAASFGVLLASILEHPEKSIEVLPLMTAADRHQAVIGWNATASVYPREATLAGLFAEQAAQAPERTAWEHGGEELGYGELDHRSNQLARFLIDQGVRRGDLVGFFLEPSAALLVAILGIVKSGAVYLPLDLAYPVERLALMIGDGGPPLLLTQEALASRLPETSARVVCLDTAWEEIARGSDAAVATGGSADDLAYVIYTSGSTGRPKGVAVPQRAVVRLVRNTDYIRLSAGDRIAQLANLSFDAATFEIWGALLNGGTVVGVPQDTALSPRDLAVFLRERRIDSLFLTTTLFNQVAQLAPEAFGPVRDVLFGGEACDPGAVRRVLRTAPPARLLHVYGPTENTTFSTWFAVEEVAEGVLTIPIGRPLANSRAYVLDGLSQPVPVPVGVVGELYVGGDGLAREYLNRPELTAERFVEVSSLSGERLYRTGDLVRRLADGSIEFRGRVDDQVKIRGFRIEPGEIEAQLLGHPSVREAVVLAREDRPGEKRLVAYVVGTNGGEPDPGRLRDHLASKLPQYMVPSAIVPLERLPLTANGKVDRRVLPAPEMGDLQRGKYVAPRTELERRLCEIWEELLGVDRVGIEDDFFELGGHSLLATRVVSRVRLALGREMPLRMLFEHPTIGDLCESLPELSGGWGLPSIEVVTQRENLPLSYAQQRLWFIDRLEGGSRQYNIPSAALLRGSLDKVASAVALRTIVERHESLRTVFRQVNGEVVQVVRQGIDFQVPETDLSHLEYSGEGAGGAASGTGGCGQAVRSEPRSDAARGTAAALRSRACGVVQHASHRLRRLVDGGADRGARHSV